MQQNGALNFLWGFRLTLLKKEFFPFDLQINILTFKSFFVDKLFESGNIAHFSIMKNNEDLSFIFCIYHMV